MRKYQRCEMMSNFQQNKQQVFSFVDAISAEPLFQNTIMCCVVFI